MIHSQGPPQPVSYEAWQINWTLFGGGRGGAAVGESGELSHVHLNIHTIQRFHIKQSVWFRFYGRVERLVGTELHLSNLQEESRARPPLRKLSEESWLKKMACARLGSSSTQSSKTQESTVVKNVSKHPGTIRFPNFFQNGQTAILPKIFGKFTSAREKDHIFCRTCLVRRMSAPSHTAIPVRFIAAIPRPSPVDLEGLFFFRLSCYVAPALALETRYFTETA